MVKFLVIRFSSIGDIVLTSPLVRCLKQQVEGAEVHFITKESFRSVVEQNPNISKVFTIKESIYEVLPQLKDEDYDYIIDLHYNLRSVLLKMKLKKLSFTFKKLNLKKWMLVNFKYSSMPKIHIVDRYMETVKPFGVENDGRGLDFFIAKTDEVDLLTLPATHQNGYTAFVIGAKHFTKRMPFEKLDEICRSLSSPILLIGGPEDKETGDRLMVSAGSHVFNGCGKFNIGQSASLIKQSACVITHDTGMMHIAASFGKKIVSVWGNTVPEFGMTPYLPKGSPEPAIIEVNGLSCRPCSKIGFNKCPRSHFKCMNLIPVEEVIRAAKK